MLFQHPSNREFWRKKAGQEIDPSGGCTDVLF